MPVEEARGSEEEISPAISSVSVRAAASAGETRRGMADERTLPMETSVFIAYRPMEDVAEVMASVKKGTKVARTTKSASASARNSIVLSSLLLLHKWTFSLV